MLFSVMCFCGSSLAECDVLSTSITKGFNFKSGSNKVQRQTVLLNARLNCQGMSELSGRFDSSIMYLLQDASGSQLKLSFTFDLFDHSGELMSYQIEPSNIESHSLLGRVFKARLSEDKIIDIKGGMTIEGVLATPLDIEGRTLVKLTFM